MPAAGRAKRGWRGRWRGRGTRFFLRSVSIVSPCQCLPRSESWGFYCENPQDVWCLHLDGSAYGGSLQWSPWVVTNVQAFLLRHLWQVKDLSRQVAELLGRGRRLCGVREAEDERGRWGFHSCSFKVITILSKRPGDPYWPPRMTVSLSTLLHNNQEQIKCLNGEDICGQALQRETVPAARIRNHKKKWRAFVVGDSANGARRHPFVFPNRILWSLPPSRY